MTILVAIEGADAGGKATQTQRLMQYLCEQNVSAKMLSLPNYDSITGELIRGHLTGDWKAELMNGVAPPHERRLYRDNVGTYLFQCCQLVNRMETIPDELWNRSDDTVYVADRYNASAYAYGLAFGLDFGWLVNTHRHLPQPDINILLDVPVEESFRRRPDRRDNYEKDASLLRRVRECYLDVFSQLGKSYVVIDGCGSIDDVFGRIMSHVAPMCENRISAVV